jgi:hypothetical protein
VEGSRYRSNARANPLGDDERIHAQEQDDRDEEDRVILEALG